VRRVRRVKIVIEKKPDQTRRRGGSSKTSKGRGQGGNPKIPSTIREKLKPPKNPKNPLKGKASARPGGREGTGTKGTRPRPECKKSKTLNRSSTITAHNLNKTAAQTRKKTDRTSEKRPWQRKGEKKAAEEGSPKLRGPLPQPFKMGPRGGPKKNGGGDQLSKKTKSIP